MKWKNIAIISSGYHVPRAKLLTEKLRDFSEADDSELQEALDYIENENVNLRFIPSEEILYLRSEHYKNYMQKVFDTPEYKARVAAEKKGIEDLKSDKYQPKKL